MNFLPFLLMCLNIAKAVLLLILLLVLLRHLNRR